MRRVNITKLHVNECSSGLQLTLPLLCEEGDVCGPHVALLQMQNHNLPVPVCIIWEHLVDMHNRQKRKRTFPVNQLKKWHAPLQSTLYAEEVTDDAEDVPAWTDNDSSVRINKQLDQEQYQHLQSLLLEFKMSLTRMTSPGVIFLARLKYE